MNLKKRIMRIVDNAIDSDRFPLALLDSEDTVLRIGASVSELREIAFDVLNASDVHLDFDLAKAAERLGQVRR